MPSLFRKFDKGKDSEKEKLIEEGANVPEQPEKTYGTAEKKDTKDAKAQVKQVSLRQLFRYASEWDLVLLIVGIIVSVLTGAGRPFLAIIMGGVTNNFVSAQKSYPTYQFSKDGNFNDTTGGAAGGTVSPETSMDDFLHRVNQGSLQYTYLGIAMFISAYMQMTCWLVTCERQIHKIRQEFFKAILRQNIAYFDEKQSGEMTAKLADNLERIKEGIGDKLGLFVQTSGTFVAGFVVAFVYNWKMTLVMMSATPLLVIFAYFIVKLIQTASKNEQQQYSVAGGIAEEVLSCVQTVIAFNGQEHECHRYGDALEKGKKEGTKKSLYSGAMQGVLFFIIFGCYALAFWYGTQLVLKGEIDPGLVFTVFWSVLSGSLSLGTAAPLLSAVAIARGSASAVYEIIDREPEIDSYSEAGTVIDKPKGRIQFENVKFNYPSRKDVTVLDGLSLTVEPGETIALCGSSGCGKSTVINLILRFYDPDSGKVAIDGHPVKDLNLSFLRNMIGVVSQEPVLFETTIEQNIKFGKDKLSRQDMIKAAKMANAHDFITKLPQGYQTLCGEGGTQLSGGQKQRVAIARALVRDPKILLLDEATSALDAESEGIVQEALDKVILEELLSNRTIGILQAAQGRTTIVVAHRLSTIRNADKIWALHKGKVVEAGSHAELMQKKELYYQLVTAQLFEDTGSGYVSATDATSEGKETADQLVSETPRTPRRQSSRFRRQSSTHVKRTMSEDSGSLAGSELSHTSSLARKRSSMFQAANKVDTEKDRLKRELAEEGAKQSSFFQIFKAARPEWGYLLIALLGSAIGGAIMPGFSYLLGEMMNVFSKEGQELEDGGSFIAVMLLVVGIADAVSTFFATFFFGVSGERLTSRLRLTVFKNILRQDVSYFDAPKHSTGKLCTRLATDAPNVKLAVDFRLSAVLGAFISMIAGTVMAFIFGWQMALLLLALLPLIGFGGYIRSRVFESKNQGDTKLLEEAGKTAAEAIENVRTVQALTKEKTFFKIYNSHLLTPHKHSMGKAHVQALSFALAYCMFYFVSAVSFKFGGFLVEKGVMEPVSVFRVFFAINFCGMTLGFATAYFPEYLKARYSGALIFKMLAEEPKIDSYSKAGLQPEISGAVTFGDVYFKYPTRMEASVLNGLQFQLAQGKSIALVGQSGCGKSTVVKLIERFYDPVQGQILIDDYDLRTINIGFIRRQLALVSQEPVLFDCSLEDNIVYGLKSVSHEKVVKCAKLANIHDFIESLPEGYKTRVGEKGTQLSGGQKQRVAIARALVRDPKILLLDEATSALDTESEKVVQEALDRAREGRTCIIIAHRLSTVQSADSIAVIKNGKVIEQGSHGELVARKGAYFSLTKKQQLQH